MRFKVPALSIFLSLAIAPLALATPRPPERKEVAGVAIQIIKRSRTSNYDFGKNLRNLDGYDGEAWTNHSFTVNADEKRANVVPLTDFGSDIWHGPISVGTPPQHFEGKFLLCLMFDTGSRQATQVDTLIRSQISNGSRILLPSIDCTTCDDHVRWDPKASATSENLKETFKYKYVDGSGATGDLYTDTVSIGGLTVAAQTINAATVYSGEMRFPAFVSDGVLGLGFQHVLGGGPVPIFQNLVSQGQVVEPVFSFQLSTSGGELYIGGSNSELYTGSFVFVPVQAGRSWKVNMDNIQYNGQAILTNIPAIIDTGTNHIVGTVSQVAALHNALGARFTNGDHVFPCNEFPIINFSFGGTLFPISRSTLNIGEASARYCYSGIVATGHLTNDVWLIGTIFLQNVYTRFDFGNRQIGFARLA